MDKDKLWNEFMQTGSVESYLNYTQSRDETGKGTNEDGNRGLDNQVNQIR